MSGEAKGRGEMRVVKLGQWQISRVYLCTKNWDELAGTDPGKRQMFGSGRRIAAYKDGTKLRRMYRCCEPADSLSVVQKIFAVDEKFFAGGVCGN